MRDKQGREVCESCSTPDKPLLPFGNHQYCSDCAREVAIYDASQQHMLELLTPHLEEVTRAWWEYWSPHGIERSDMRWDVEQAVEAFLGTLEAQVEG